MGGEPSHEMVVQANIRYHTALAERYEAAQPHYRPENVERVAETLVSLAAQTSGGALLDIGCGSGFVVGIARRSFRQVVGVDVTLPMLHRVVGRKAGVRVVLADSTRMPLRDWTFDVCVAYGVLHHLREVGPTLREAFRCLKPGGVLYTDQDPNHDYWALMHELAGAPALSPVVQREVEAVVRVAEALQADFGLDPETIALAEYQKVERRGFRPEELVEEMRQAGFESVETRYEWFLGQGTHDTPDWRDRVRVIDEYLRARLPATHALFKYLRVLAVKPGGRGQ